MIFQIRPVLGGFQLSAAAAQGVSTSGGATGRLFGTSGERISVLQKKITGSAKLIRSGGEIIGETEIIRKEGKTFYLARKTDKMCAKAELTCRPCSGAVSLIRPPQGVHLDMDTPYGRWQADRQQDQSVLFIRASTVIGKISPFFSIRPQIFACSGEYPASLWAVLYVFAAYMMHEGEVDII